MTDDLEKLEAEIAAQQKALEALKAEKANMAKAKEQIEKTLNDSGYTLAELFPQIVRPAPARRQLGMPKFKIGDQTFDGRTARREKAFEKYVVDGALNLTALAKDGLINPKWAKDASPRQLADMGITNVDEYVKKYGTSD